jgi:molecular chaperone DnaK (HSP70)
MVKNAEKFKDEDKKNAERVEARNGLESYLYNLKNSIVNAKDVKVSEEDKKTIETLVADGMKWLDENNSASKEDYDAKQKEFEEKINPIMASMYGAMGGGTQPNAATSEPVVEEVD